MDRNRCSRMISFQSFPLTYKLLEITKEYDLSSTSWADQKYETATTAAIHRAPLLKYYLSRIQKDDRFKFDLVKRMITVKAKKQTELEMKRRHRSGTNNENMPSGLGKKGTSADVVSVDSPSRSPDEHVPMSPKSSPIPPYTLGYAPPTKPILPEPHHHGRGVSILSPQSAQSNQSDISDIFLAQAHRRIPRRRY